MAHSGECFNEQSLRQAIANVWGKHGAHMDVYDVLCRSLDDERDIARELAREVLFLEEQVEQLRSAVDRLAREGAGGVMLEVLDDLELSLRMADVDRAMLVAFVWAQRRDYLLAGSESWDDQKIRPPKLGGTSLGEVEVPDAIEP